MKEENNIDDDEIHLHEEEDSSNPILDKEIDLDIEEDNPTDKEGPDIEASVKSHNVEFINDPEVDKAVDKIVNEESDELMDSQDSDRESQFEAPKTKKTKLDKFKNFFRTWWSNRYLRYGSLFAFILFLSALAFVPSTRYGLLNTAGVRVESSMTVVDSETGLPLENIPVLLQGQEIISDDQGSISFSGLKLGESRLVIEKIGYATYEKELNLGWGSNPLGPQSLTATGTQFTFVLSDWLSEAPILAGEATSGENIASSDEQGHISLVVGDLSSNTEAVIKSEGYRDEVIMLSDVVSEDYVVKMVPSKKHVFVSNRTGEYDLYKIDVDGQNEEILLAATGKEREVPFVLPHQTKDFVAYISSRAGDLNKDNFKLDGLYIVDVNSGEDKKITRSEQLQLIGWVGDRLIYVAVVEGVSAGNSQRSRIFSYDVNSGDKTEIATSNYFNDVKLVDGKVYYSISSYAVPKSAAKLYTINTDGSDRKPLIDTQVWSIIRADFETVVLNAINLQWFEQKIGQDAIKLDQPPVSRQSRYYSVSPNGDQAMWVDIRDGKGVLLKYNVTTKTDEIIRTESGLSAPVYWLSDNYVIYRVSTNQETADYILNLDGGEPRKISDVLGNRSRYFY